MKFICIIPARYASTRFPGKPLALIHNKTMIQRVYEQVSLVLKEVWVATDDKRIEKAVKQFGGKVVMTATTHQSGTDRVAEAINNIEKSTNQTFDVVINVQGDEPFIQPEQIHTIMNCFQQPKTAIATLIKPIKNEEEIFDSNKVKVVVGNAQQALYFSRSPIPFLRGVPKEEWLSKELFYKHIGMYAYKKEVLKEITQLPQSKLEKAESLEQLRWLENGYYIQTEETNHESIGIDTPADLENVIQKGQL